MADEEQTTAYATRDDITSRHGEDMLLRIADRDGDDVVDDDAVNLALESASSEIDSYVATRYPVPLSSPSAMVTQVCVDIAVYRLASSESALTEEMRKRYDDAIKWLQAVAKGDAAIVTPSTGDDEDDPDEDGTANVGALHSAGFFRSTRG